MKYAISTLMIRRPCPAPNDWSNDLVDTHPERLNATIATTRHMFVLPLKSARRAQRLVFTRYL